MLRRLVSLNRDQRLMWLSSLLWGFGMSLFIYIQPLYVASLGASPAEIGLVLGASGIFVTVFYIPIGLWADRYGRKPLILAGWGLGALATLAMAFVPDWRWLVPAMAVYNFSNFALPALNGYIAASETNGNLSRTIALLNTGGALGSILSPAVGGWIGELSGLRVVYFCAGITFLLSTLTLAFLTPQPVTPATSASRTPRQLLGNRSFLWQIVFVFLLYFSLEISHILAPKFLEDVRRLSVAQIGGLGSVASLGVITLQLLFGALSPHRRLPLLLCQLTALAGTLLWLNTSLLGLIVLAYFIHGYNRVVRPIAVGRIARSLDSATLSFGYGFYETAFRLGLAVAPYAAGLLYERDPSWPMLAGIGGLGLTMALTFTLPARRPRAVSATPLAESP
jgi:predicted MFS family arabinose efflux permease